MARYRYKAADAAGEVVRGTLEAAARNNAVADLRGRGLIPIRVDEAGAGGAAPAKGRRTGRKRISHEALVMLTRELATLMQARLPLDRALAILISLSEDQAVAGVLGGVQQKLQEGATLGDALEAHGEVFNRFYVNLVRAGEAGGALEDVLMRLAEHLERGKEVRDTLVSALIYPAVLVFVAMLSIMLLLGYVVPEFKDLFEGVGQVLPLPTRITIAVGDFLQTWGWTLIPAFFGLTWLLRRQLASPRGRYRWDARVLKVPIAGDLVQKVEVARFARTLSALLHNGVPLLKGLTIVRETIANQVIAAGIEQVTGSLKEGQSLAGPLSQAGCFPAFAVQMIRVGEESGRLEEMLLQVADVYDRETQTTLKRALTLLEPILILVLGLVVGGVIMSILMAILGVNQLVF